MRGTDLRPKSLQGQVNARAADRRANEKANTEDWAWVAAYKILKAIRSLLWGMRTTLCWVIMLLVCLSWQSNVILALYAVILIGLCVRSYWDRKMTRVLPIYGDYLRIMANRSRMQDIRRGNDYLLHCGIDVLTHDGAYNHNVYMSTDDRGNDVLTVESPLPGYPSAKIAKTVDEYKEVRGAVRTQVLKDGAGMRIVMYREDPLDDDRTINKPYAVKPDKMTIRCAADSYGDPIYLSLNDKGGMLIGGLSGAGKTAAVSSILLPLALSKYASISIIDGKGGDDWSAYAPIAANYIPEDNNLEEVVAFLEGHRDSMRARVKGQTARLGTSNFWSVSADQRLQAGQKLEVLVIDECQTYFDDSGRTNEERKLVHRAVNAVAEVVRKGRSAGYYTIVITQKPTIDTVPGKIRDNLNDRMALRLGRRTAEEAVLGQLPDELVGMSLAIPQDRQGGIVLADDRGNLTPARCYYVPEPRQREIIKSHVRKQRAIARNH